MADIKEYVERSWYLRHQPKTLDDLKLPDWMKSKFQEMIEDPSKATNLLFVGLPGSGKTTLTRILVNSWLKSKDDYIQINGSGLKIDVVRASGDDPSKGVVQRFASMPPVKSPFRIVHFEEMQRGGGAVQDVYKYLRSLIEMTAKYTNYIVTTNSVSEIDPPLLQRFHIYTFNVLPKQDIKEYLQTVLEKENVSYDVKDLDYVVDYFYPSVRAMINTLQQYTVNGTLQLDKNLIAINTKVLQLVIDVLTSRDINSNSFKELTSLLRYNSSLLDINFIVRELIYKANPHDQLIISRYSATMLDSLLPDIALLSLLGEILMSNNQIQRM